MPRLCSKCNVTISNRQFLKCSVCNKNFHITCTTVNQKRYDSFYAFNKENKSKWKCRSCQGIGKKVHTVSSPAVPTPKPVHTTDSSTNTPNCSSVTHISENENKIIVNVHTENSFDSLEIENENDDENHDPVCRLSRSFPTLGDTPQDQLHELKQRVIDLDLRLLSAENEVTNLLRVNRTLEKRLAAYEGKITNLTELCKSSPTQSDQ